MEQQTIRFVQERVTKNTIRYAEDAGDGPARIGTLYVQKWVLGTPPPPVLVVTITTEGAEEG